MAHTQRNKDKLIARVRRIRGQLEAVERALDAQAPCGEVLRQLASARGAMNGLTAQVMEDHLQEHVIQAKNATDCRTGAIELVDVIRAYLK